LIGLVFTILALNPYYQLLGGFGGMTMGLLDLGCGLVFSTLHVAVGRATRKW